MKNCRHGRLECECMGSQANYISTQPLSSGRWDASGSWEEAIKEQSEKCREWAESLRLDYLYECIVVMTSDVNAFSLYERKALLEVVAKHLKKDINAGTY